jgi:hypothetical protein
MKMFLIYNCCKANGYHPCTGHRQDNCKLILEKRRVQTNCKAYLTFSQTWDYFSSTRPEY